MDYCRIDYKEGFEFRKNDTYNPYLKRYEFQKPLPWNLHYKRIKRIKNLPNGREINILYKRNE